MEKYRTLVEEQIKSLNIDEKTPSGLYIPVQYAMSAGGKHIRPILTLLSCKLFCDDFEQALLPAVAIELFHNFTLLHDDLMDNADLRRNRATVHKRWNENTAILSGDAMMILSCRYLCESHPDKVCDLLDTFTRAAIDVCEGQQYDMDFEQCEEVTIERYITMIRLKTAALIAASLKIGAICGEADKASCEALYNFGISLGIAFQLQDDWLDVYSDPALFGKATGGDILNRKKTFLLLTALESADKETRERLLLLLNSKVIPDKEKIENVTAIYDSLGVSEVTQHKISEYFQQAIIHLYNVSIADRSRMTELEQFTVELLKRAK